MSTCASYQSESSVCVRRRVDGVVATAARVVSLGVQERGDGVGVTSGVPRSRRTRKRHAATPFSEASPVLSETGPVAVRTGPKSKKRPPTARAPPDAIDATRMNLQTPLPTMSINCI